MSVERRLIQVQLAVAADAAKTWYCPVPTGTWRALTPARFTPSSAGAVTANDTNYGTLSIKKASTTIGSRATTVAGGALVAGTEVQIALSGGSSLEFIGGTNQIVVEADGTPGTGQPLDGVLLIEIEKMRG